MSEKNPFVVHAADQSEMEDLVSKTPASETDYRKLFEETDPLRENMASGVASVKCADLRELPGNSEEMKNISGNIGNHIRMTEENMNMIAKTHSGKGKKLFLKAAGWPARRYLDPQIRYNECSVRINEDIMKMVDYLKSDSQVVQQEAKERQEAVLAVCGQLASHMELMKKRIEQLEAQVIGLEQKNQDLEERLASKDGRN